MTWSEAVQAMHLGNYVRRTSDMTTKLVQEGNVIDPEPVYESGQEGCFLAHAWTVEEEPTIVFMGYPSRCLFVPDDEDRLAIDWIIVGKNQC